MVLFSTPAPTAAVKTYHTASSFFFETKYNNNPITMTNTTENFTPPSSVNTRKKAVLPPVRLSTAICPMTWSILSSHCHLNKLAKAMIKKGIARTPLTAAVSPGENDASNLLFNYDTSFFLYCSNIPKIDLCFNKKKDREKSRSRLSFPYSIG